MVAHGCGDGRLVPTCDLVHLFCGKLSVFEQWTGTKLATCKLAPLLAAMTAIVTRPFCCVVKPIPQASQKTAVCTLNASLFVSLTLGHPSKMLNALACLKTGLTKSNWLLKISDVLMNPCWTCWRAEPKDYLLSTTVNTCLGQGLCFQCDQMYPLWKLWKYPMNC